MKILVDCRSVVPDKMGGIDHTSDIFIKSLSSLDSIEIFIDVQKEYEDRYKEKFINNQNVKIIFDPVVAYFRDLRSKNFISNFLLRVLNAVASLFNQDLLNRRNSWKLKNDYDVVFYPYHLDKYLHKNNKYFVFIHAIFSYYNTNLLKIIDDHIKDSNAIIVAWPHPYKTVKHLANEKNKCFNIPFYSDINLRDNHEKIRFFGKKNYLFYPSIISKRKNHKLILEAYRILHRESKEIPEMVFSGGGSEKELRILKDLSREYGVENKISFLGYVNDSELNYLYENCIGTISASREEAGYVTINEGGSIGKPAICPNTPSAKEHARLFGMDVCFFEDNDPIDLAEKILFFQENIKKYQLSARESSKVIRSFNTKYIALKLKEIINYLDED